MFSTNRWYSRGLGECDSFQLCLIYLEQLSVGKGEYECWSSPMFLVPLLELKLKSFSAESPMGLRGECWFSLWSLKDQIVPDKLSSQTWMSLRQLGWLSPSILRGLGGKSICGGFPSRLSNRLRPQVVMAVRDPLPGLQSNKVTYVGKGRSDFGLKILIFSVYFQADISWSRP